MPLPARSLKVVVDRPSLRERTTEILRNAILDMHFAPGQKLVERKLCEETGVSRTCVREALRCLEAEALVVSTPNRGMFVAEIGWNEARQIYEIRGILEPAMARLFVERASAEQIQAMRLALRRVEDTIFVENAASNAAALDTFFETMIIGSANEVAQQLLKSLRARITYLRTMTARATSQEQRRNTINLLREIVDALAKRDADGAEKACRAMVMNSMKFAEHFFQTQPNERVSIRA
ncbi:MAG: GntR family transcriptional regulator [Pseudorhodoplanes sp.]